MWLLGTIELLQTSIVMNISFCHAKIGATFFELHRIAMYVLKRTSAS